MDSLFNGVRAFCQKDFEKHRELFANIGREQAPHTLFIGCSDSRVVPNLITRTLPGDLFVVRNIANIVPHYRETEEFVATTSAIEYAVIVLNVENIVVCGHSNCGGCNALLKEPHELDAIPHTKKWLLLAQRVRQQVLSENIGDPLEREWRTEQLNIIEQMNHLLTYPYIEARHRSGRLKLFGWHYIIETGDVYNYSQEAGRFIRIE